MAVTSRTELIDYCFRRLGEPVTEINVDITQAEERIDDAIQYYQEYHKDATVRTFLSHQITDSDMTNGYIPISSNIVYLSRMFPLNRTFDGTADMFDITYQIYLNNMADFTTFAGDLAYIYHIEQYLSLIDMQLHGTPQVNFSRREGKLYIHGDFNDGDLKTGDWVVAEIYQIVDPNGSGNTIWDDMFIKDYSTALIKEQWGQNMKKFDGMLLPGGVTVNGAQIYEEAVSDIERLREQMRLEHEEPVDFMVG